MQPLRGISFKIASVLLLIVMAALVKAATERVPAGQAVFFRSFFALPVILAWLTWRGELRTGWRTARPLGHVWRGLAGTASMGCSFAALAYLPLPEATAIGYAAPLLTVVFAALFLGEVVRGFRISAVMLGMVGVLIVLSPQLTGLHSDGGTQRAIGGALALTGATLAAMAQVQVRRLVATEPTATIVFWFSLTAAGLSLLTAPFGWVVPTGPEFAMLVCAGLLGGVGQILLTSSYKHADASVVAPFEYVSIVFALGIGYWVFGDLPTLTMLAGAALVVLAGILIIWRERRLGLSRARQRKAMTPQS
ncbi:DMT family transporter [Ruixingdingia sedimenti]|uniref:DMT family transporter n=1 Tax=Ruixingdingia sedimenti TaxID=3073604 RepID=A0ABU1F9L7_9RHOB|nr:DMT family transporter [Xinfangfangia sp. LG-4]MDR5653278.1 DMT family transporter [Xinfangfangia sp. LG-4]